MIIFGTRHRKVPVPNGKSKNALCPNCGCERLLTEHRIRPYFTLYFIPVFPVGKGTSVMTCTACGSDYVMNHMFDDEDPRMNMDMWR